VIRCTALPARVVSLVVWQHGVVSSGL